MINVVGQSLTVTQDGGLGDECQFFISPQFKSFVANGGTGVIQVIGHSRCAWQAQSNTSWIIITLGDAGIGNSTVTYVVAHNPSATGRSGIISIAERSFAVKQKGSQ